jgi:hypothetical protein
MKIIEILNEKSNAENKIEKLSRKAGFVDFHVKKQKDDMYFVNIFVPKDEIPNEKAFAEMKSVKKLVKLITDKFTGSSVKITLVKGTNFYTGRLIVKMQQDSKE